MDLEVIEKAMRERNLDAVVHYKKTLASQCFSGASFELEKLVASILTWLAEQMLFVGDVAKAHEFLSEALIYSTTDAQIYHGLGFISHKSTRDFTTAYNAYSRALMVCPSFEPTYIAIAELLRTLGKLKDERDILLLGTSHCSKSSVLWNALGCNEIATMKFSNAQGTLDKLTKCLRLKPDPDTRSLCYNNIGHVFSNTGDVREAFRFFVKSAKVEGANHRIVALSWHNILLHSLYFNVPPETMTDLCNGVAAAEHTTRIIEALHTQVADTFYPSQDIFEKASTVSKQQKPRKLRIGYLGADFCGHPVSHFITPCLKKHTSAVEVHIFSNTYYGEETIAELRCKEYTYIGDYEDESLAKLISSKDLDVLVDLSGYSNKTRVSVMAYHPARHHFTFLGYPAGVGMRWVRHIGDAFTEKNCASSIKVPGCFLTYDPLVPIDDSWKKRHRARKDFIVLGSMGKLQKISDEVVTLWNRILTEIDDTVLMIISRQLSDPDVRSNWKEKFPGFESRVEFSQGTKTHEEHLQEYRKADIMLDTWPYSGTTITCESLMLGLPVLTLAPVDGVHASRVSGSILRHCGLTQFIAHNQTEYVTLLRQTMTEVKSDSASELFNFVRTAFEHKMRDGESYIERLECMFTSLA